MDANRDYSVNYFYLGDKENLTEIELRNHDYCLIKVITGQVFCITSEDHCFVCSNKYRRSYYAKNITNILLSALDDIKNRLDVFKDFNYPAKQITFSGPTGTKPIEIDYLMFNYFIFHGFE